MDELKETISKNLVQLRAKAHLTQMQLAEMLNYSDKAVSKWERGEAIPDIRVLIQICKIYGITLDELVTKKNVAEAAHPVKHINVRRVLITCISAVFVWFLATVIFIALYFISPTRPYAWMVFVVAPLPMSIVLLVFCVLWWNKALQGITSSLVLWSCVLIVQQFTSQFAPEFEAIFWIYLGAAVFEVLIILWFVFRWFMTKQLPKMQADRQARNRAAGKKDSKAASAKAAKAPKASKEAAGNGGTDDAQAPKARRTPRAPKMPKADLSADSTDTGSKGADAAAEKEGTGAVQDGAADAKE